MESAGGLIVLALFMVVMYLLMIRPQQKRQREHQQLISELDVGADVVTIGGLHGRIEAVGDDYFDLLVNPDVVLRFQKSAIARTVTEDETADETADEDEAVS
ncbi:MAG: preprotein translocase subunit YajC [Actinobacteria bacterium]|nr:preprotein translocase subunit YajC [Actinomycetota bacterium]